jgi:hypothetical protein
LGYSMNNPLPTKKGLEKIHTTSGAFMLQVKRFTGDKAAKRAHIMRSCPYGEGLK